MVLYIVKKGNIVFSLRMGVGNYRWGGARYKTRKFFVLLKWHSLENEKRNSQIFEAHNASGSQSITMRPAILSIIEKLDLIFHGLSHSLHFFFKTELCVFRFYFISLYIFETSFYSTQKPNTYGQFWFKKIQYIYLY